MNRSRVAATIVTLAFLAACSSGGGQKVASPKESSTALGVSSSPTVAVQTAIPDGTYRTRPRTVQDLVVLGLTKGQIAKDRVNEHFHKTIVYELSIQGDQLILTAAEDGGVASLVDQEILTVTGHTLTLTSPPGFTPCKYVMRFSMSHGVLKLTLLDNTCTDPECCTDALVRSAYEALPFKAVS